MAYPNLRQATWLVVLVILIEAGMGILIHVAGLISVQPLEHNNYLLGISRLGVFLLILLYVSRRTDRRWVSFLRPAKSHFDSRVWPCVAISIAGIVVVIHELNKAVVCVFPMPETFREIFHTSVGRGTSFPSALFQGTVVAPYVEELFYRGIVLSGLLANYTRTSAIIWSSILFTASHLNPWQFPAALLGGGVLAWWVIRTGSLWPAVVGHALNNLLFTTFFHFEIPFFAVPEDLNVVVFNPWWWTGAGMILAALGLLWFFQISNMTQSADTDAFATADTLGDGD